MYNVLYCLYIECKKNLSIYLRLPYLLLLLLKSYLIYLICTNVPYSFTDIYELALKEDRSVIYLLVCFILTTRII